MIGVIDVGGGLRGSYGAGVFDYCMKQNIQFDYVLGVSAGSANGASYLGHQIGRNYVFYTEYMKRSSYMGLHSFLHTGSYVGLEYIYGDLSDSWGEYPLDWQKIVENPAQLVIPATDALTGEAFYFSKESMGQDDYCAIKASCNVPVVDKPFIIDGIPYYDGGIADPVPVDKAFADGCDKVVLILTKPKDMVVNSKRDAFLAEELGKKYPMAGKAMAQKDRKYNESVAKAKKLEEEGKVLIVSPESIGHMKTLTRNENDIRNLYLQGYRNAASIPAFVEN